MSHSSTVIVESTAWRTKTFSARGRSFRPKPFRPTAGPRLYFQAVPEDKIVKNRVHICLQPDDRNRDAEVDRLLALGATVADDHRTPDGGGWVALLDPAGNEFCMTRSAAERQS